MTHPRLATTGVIAASVVASLLFVWLACPFGLSTDEAHYWDWSRRPDWSYYSKGPLVAWIIRASCELLGPLSIALTGDLTAAVRTPAVVCHAALLGGWYVLAADVFRSSRLGLWVVACAVTLPLVRAGAVLMTIDPPFLACWCWALVCVQRGLARGSRGWWVAAGCCTALGILAKYTMVLLPVAVLAFLLTHRRGELRRSGVWLFLGLAASGALPIVVWNAGHDWVSVRHVLGQVGGEAKPGFRWLGPLAFVAGQLGMLFAGWLAAAALAALRFRPDRERDDGVRLLWWSSVPVWCLFLVASFVKPGQPNWPAPAYVGGFVLTVAWLREALSTGRPWPRLTRCGLVMTVIASVLVSIAIHVPDVVRPLLARLSPPPSDSNPLPVRKLDPTARLAGWRELAAVVDDIRNRVRAATGQEPVIAGTHWTLPGLLRFYCEGHPDVFCIGVANGSDRHSQYDLWRPNPVADAQLFRDRSFVIVGDIGPATVAAFEGVERPTHVVHRSGGVPIAAWTVWVAHGYRGYGPNEVRKAHARY